jgi:hypothetical protein
MKALLLFISTRFLKLVKCFAHADQNSEKRFFGLGQFVVLLTLAPFILNLSLYSVGNQKKVASHYEYNPNRFALLPTPQPLLPPPSFSDYTTKPPVLKSLSKKENNLLQFCHQWSVRHQTCIDLKKKQRQNNKAYLNAFNQYMKGYKKFLLDNKKYKATQTKYKADIDATYQAFQYNSAKPTPLPAISIKQYTSRSYIGLLEDTAGNRGWQQITNPLWWLGALLMIPTLVLSIRKQRWALLAFGLSVPAFNYLLSIPNMLLDFDTFSDWQISSAIAAQIAFCWFAISGHIRSKSFVYFILLMIFCTFLPSLSSHDEAFSAVKAQLPILVFIVVAAMGRLIVKGARENTYLLKSLGWSRNLRTLLHSFILWLPMAILATPFLYLSEVAIPRQIIDQLYQQNILKFDHSHDILDNALQSTASKTDDLIYAWYLKTQGIKKDIYDKKTALNKINLAQISQIKFDEIVPKSLVFEKQKSDTPIVGFIIDLSVTASQQSTNNAYELFRQSMKDSMAEMMTKTEPQLKDGINKNVLNAFNYIDHQYEQGKKAILKANKDTQTSLWWSINYLNAAHQLTLLLLAFICIKSFLYVFARVSFNRNTGAFVTLGNTRESIVRTVKSNIKPTGKAYLIDGHTNETFYISRRFQCRGKAPKFNVPQPFHAPIARLLHGAYTMNKVVMQIGDDPVSCTASKGIEFYEWSLADGETVILDFHHFVGMSDNVKISTLISPRMTSLLLGKIIYSQATGPGKLIVMAKGRAEMISNVTSTGSLPPERLIAMHKNTHLHIDSELDLINIYLSTAYVRPAGGGNMLVDVDSQRGAKSGLASFIKHFILPI